MTDVLTHRRPDGEGICLFPSVDGGVPVSLRLNGIFALAIWDRERSELFLARDHLWVKPLYYALHRGVMYFASEVKALLPALPRPQLRRDAVATYLTFLWVPDVLIDALRIAAT